MAEQTRPTPQEMEEWAHKIAQGSRGYSSRRDAASARSVVETGPGGLAHYQVDELWEEITYLGYHLHWDLDTLLNLAHRDRRMLVRRVAGLNERAWEEAESHGR